MRIKYQVRTIGRPRGPWPSKAVLARLYVKEGKSVREVAAVLGISDAAVKRRLHAAGVVMRSNARRSRLRLLNQARLFADINDLGVDRTAAKWGIPERTLKYYLSKLRAKRKDSRNRCK